MNPYASHIKNTDGTDRCEKVAVLYVTKELRSCDGCDEDKPSASIRILGGNTMCICSDCLRDMADLIDKTEE